MKQDKHIKKEEQELIDMFKLSVIDLKELNEDMQFDPYKHISIKRLREYLDNNYDKLDKEYDYILDDLINS